MKRNSKTKVLIIVIVIAAVVVAGGFGIWYFTQNRNTEPVSVFSFQYVGMTEYWGDSQESYGPITTDRIQTIFLSGTQSVTEVMVQEGDTVKKGDLLMTFDTTLSELALERERLAVEKLKLQLENAQQELREIQNMKPMVIPAPSPDPEPDPDLGVMLSGDYQISENKEYDGSSQENPLVLWIRDSANLEDAVFEAVRVKAEEYQNANAPAPAEDAAESTTVPAEPERVSRFFMVVKVTEDNMSMGDTSVWQGMEVCENLNGTFSFRFFDASAVQDYTVPKQELSNEPEIDYGSGYTASQIAQMRAEKEKQIKDLRFQIKMAEAEYAIKQKEFESGEVTAQFDGTVVSLLSEEEAKLNNQPMLKLSGGGGFYMEGSVSELEKDNLQIGQEVTVNDWNTGMTYMGTVQSVGDFPVSTDSWNGAGNPNVSYYPFTVFIDGDADLQEGSYVNVTYSTATTEQGIYLENPFLRTEQGKSYVYVRGEDGKLEKRFVTTSKALWGSYTEVLEGLTPEDYIAFPYGKNVLEGADTVESDLSELYG